MHANRAPFYNHDCGAASSLGAPRKSLVGAPNKIDTQSGGILGLFLGCS